jgi:hypothetical protein
MVIAPESASMIHENCANHCTAGGRVLSERRESLLKFNKSAIGVIKHFLNAQLHGAGKKSENPMNPHIFFVRQNCAVSGSLH